MCIGLHVKYPLSSSCFDKTGIFVEDFQKSSNIIFYENLSRGNRVVTCEQVDRHDEANIQFCDSQNAPKNVVRDHSGNLFLLNNFIVFTSFKLLIEVSRFICACRMTDEIIAWCTVTHNPEVLNSPTHIEISLLSISIVNIFF